MSVVFRVGTKDLRRAIAAVLPFCGATKGDAVDQRFARVRVVVGSVNVHLCATDASNLAVGLVSLLDAGGDEAEFDVHPDDLKKVLAVHRLNPAVPDQELLVVVDEEKSSVQTSDVSGLFEGIEQLTFPTIPLEEQFPDVLAYMARTRLGWADELGTGREISLHRFDAAVKAYGEPIQLRLARVGLVTVGDSFIGVTRALELESLDSPTDAQAAAIAAWEDWAHRLAPFHRQTAEELGYHPLGAIDEDEPPAEQDLEEPSGEADADPPPASHPKRSRRSKSRDHLSTVD